LVDLKEKIIRGDKGDGIPNIFSPSDCFVRGLRQKPITKNIIDNLMTENIESWKDDAKTGFSRNQMLIDLSFIPQELKQRIINTYEEIKPAPKNKMLDYFISHKLKNLIDVIEEF
jgi:hypothetical protein